MSWFFFSRLASAAVAFIIVVVLARLMEPADFGRYIMLQLSATVCFAVFLSWAGTATIRFYHDARLENRALPVALGTVSWILALALPLAVAGGLLLAPDFAFAIAAAAVFCSAHAVHELGLAGLRVQHNGPQFALSMLVRPLVGVALAVVLVLRGGGGEAALLGMAFGAAVSAGLSWSRIIRRDGIARPAIAIVRPMMVYGVPLGLVMSGTMVQALISQTALGTAISMTEVGYFAAAQVVAMRVITMPMLTLAQAADASIFKSVESDEEGGAERALTRYVSFLLMFAAPLAALIIVANDTLAGLVFGAAKGAQIAPHFPPLAMAAFLTGLQAAFFGFAFTISKKTGVQLVILPIVVLCHAGFTWAGVALLGATGAAYASLATAMLLLTISILVGGRYHRVRLPGMEVRQIGLAVLVAVPFGFAADMAPSGLASLGLIAAGGAVFSAALYFQRHLAFGLMISKALSGVAGKQKNDRQT